MRARLFCFGTGVLLVSVQLINVVNVLFEFLNFCSVLFLFFSEFVNFTCETNGFSIELDHDCSSDVVVDLS